MSKKSLGGKARALSLSPERRKEIAVKANKAKLLDKNFNVTHGGETSHLVLGDIKLPCFVLANGKRVILQRTMANALLLSSGGDRIPRLTNTKWLESFVSKDIVDRVENPIICKLPSGKCVETYEGTLLIDICNSILVARSNIKLTSKQKSIAEQCESIIRSVAKVGIVALIDEATGYQEEREKDELSILLKNYLAEELQSWIHTFPLDYYKQLYRLRGLEYGKQKIPSYFGHLTNNIIYKRLAPEILGRLKALTPKSKNGNNTARYFQSLNRDIGYHKLKELLGSVVTLMKLSDNYDDFEVKLNKIHPLFIKDE